MVLTMIDAVGVAAIESRQQGATAEAKRNFQQRIGEMYPVLVIQMRDYMLALFALTYRPFTNEELETYAEFLRSDGANATYAAFFAALSDILDDRGEEIGREFATFAAQKRIRSELSRSSCGRHRARRRRPCLPRPAEALRLPPQAPPAPAARALPLRRPPPIRRRVEFQPKTRMRVDEAADGAERHVQALGHAFEGEADLEGGIGDVRSQNWCCRTTVISVGYCALRREEMRTPGCWVSKVMKKWCSPGMPVCATSESTLRTRPRKASWASTS